MKAEIQTLRISELLEAPWNPRILKEDSKEYQAIKNAVSEDGILLQDPIVIPLDEELRRFLEAHKEKKYLIVGGHQRIKILRSLGKKKVQCKVVHGKDIAWAKKRALLMNRAVGRDLPEKLSSLLSEMLNDLVSKGLGEEEALTSLSLETGFYEDELDFYLELSSFLTGEMSYTEPEPITELWVNRNFRMPLEAAEVVDRALAEAERRAGKSLKSWQSLELICADFLAGS